MAGWTVVGEPVKVGNKTSLPCKCACGITALVERVHGGPKSKSCRGCATRRNRAAKKWSGTGQLRHGHASGGYTTRTWRTWQSMCRRCESSYMARFENYGGRGIRVCDRWVNSFEAFLEDMGERPLRMSLDRIDVNGNYEPGNCRWATPSQQCRNKRNNVYLTANGITKTLVEWSESSGLKPCTISGRKKLGWSDQDAVTKPLVPNCESGVRAGKASGVSKRANGHAQQRKPPSIEP